MVIAKIKPILLSLVALAAVATLLVMQHRAEMDLRHENESLRRQLDQLSQLQAENNLFSNQLAQIQQRPPAQDEHRELLRLRGEVGLLREQSNQVLTLREEVARLRGQVAAGSTSPVQSPSATKELANISYNFQGIPTVQILDIYADLCGKKLVVDPSVNQKLMRIQTEHPITASEAKRLIEDALKEQAQVMLVPASNGTITTVSIPADQKQR
jgi:hypothetical protein